MLDSTQFISDAGLLIAFAIISATFLLVGFVRRILF